MLNSSKIIASVDTAVKAIEQYVQKYDLSESQLVTADIKVLLLIKAEIIKNPNNINERLLRGFKDVCTTMAIQFEEYDFFDPIFEIYHEFDNNIPKFKKLELLRMDFGKGDPI